MAGRTGVDPGHHRKEVDRLHIISIWEYYVYIVL
ncbi:MAG: hypothetical protein JWR14_1583 [Caballeronia sp.]|nr:hypothetical protein [Caballeronia sp.]